MGLLAQSAVKAWVKVNKGTVEEKKFVKKEEGIIDMKFFGVTYVNTLHPFCFPKVL